MNGHFSTPETSPAGAESPQNPHIFTAEEVADKLRLHRKVVSRMVARGDFPGAFKAGRDWRIPQSSVDAYIASRRVDPPASSKEAAA